MLEIERLDTMLMAAGIQHSYAVKNDGVKIWRTIWVPGDKPKLEAQRYSMIQHSSGSYGAKEGLIELWDLREERPRDEPMDAEECFEIIKADERIKAAPT